MAKSNSSISVVIKNLMNVLPKRPFMTDSILIFSILLSLAMHVSWFSLVTVVNPKEQKIIKFSKVSFFGSAFERGMIEARASRKEHSFLEKRYLEDLRIPSGTSLSMNAVYDDNGPVPNVKAEMDFKALVTDALESGKIEPKL